VDTLDLTIFHLIVDTSVYDVEETYRIIKTAVEARISKLNYKREG